MKLALLAAGTRPYYQFVCFMYFCLIDKVIEIVTSRKKLSLLNRLCSIEWEDNCEW